MFCLWKSRSSVPREFPINLSSRQHERELETVFFLVGFWFSIAHLHLPLGSWEKTVCDADLEIISVWSAAFLSSDSLAWQLATILTSHHEHDDCIMPLTLTHNLFQNCPSIWRRYEEIDIPNRKTKSLTLACYVNRVFFYYQKIKFPKTNV